MSNFKKQLLAGPYLIWMIGFILLPLVMIVYYALTNSDGQFTLQYITAITTETNLNAIGLSLKLSIICTLICLLLAYPLAMILKKYSSFNIGPALMLSDLLITIAGFFIFDIKTGLYSLLGLTIRSFMVDTFIENFNLSKYFNVVCDDPEPICDFIVHELNRSASVFHATGAYSGQDKTIVLTALNRTQAVRLRNFIKMTDPKAFILISNTSEIIGKGFHSI